MRKLLVGACIASVATFGAAFPASAADCAGSGELGTPDCGGVVVEGGDLEPTPAPSPAPAPATESAAPVAAQNTLPVTGVETGTMALAGAALVGGGVLLVSRSRRTEAA